MSRRSVVFIAFDRHENLGIRYLYSTLHKSGHNAHIIDFEDDKSIICDNLSELDPLLIGFSIIFENHIQKFIELISYLRQNGVNCHFTAGGHYASLRPEELFQFIPTLDSIVRFEGEETIVELADHLLLGKEWQDIAGISYKKNGKIIHNTLRPLETDLDHFPYPEHSESEVIILDRTIVPILAGRGCIHRCIFCDSLKFFEAPPGPLKRTRDPTKVVEEMDYLFREKGFSIFFFRDDDFPVRAHLSYNWIEKFCDALREKDLVGKIMWKINCRPDEISEADFILMKNHGLFQVFMGLEDGTDNGLALMKKRFRVEDSLEALEILKKMDLVIDYGFMLFHPESTFQSLHANLDFLELISRDGYLPVLFLKMMPYGEAEITNILKQQGRLKGSPGCLDYEFHERQMNAYYAYISGIFHSWMNARQGLLNNIKISLSTFSVYQFYYGKNERFNHLFQALRTTIAESNLFLIDTLRRLALQFESGKSLVEVENEEVEFHKQMDIRHQGAVDQIDILMSKLNMLTLLKSIFIPA